MQKICEKRQILCKNTIVSFFLHKFIQKKADLCKNTIFLLFLHKFSKKMQFFADFPRLGVSRSQLALSGFYACGNIILTCFRAYLRASFTFKNTKIDAAVTE